MRTFKIFFINSCDGNFDCPNANDERNCSRTCSAAQFKCETTNMCIPKVWECDGDADCSDGSDEKSCEARTCFSIEFRCNSGRCIPLHWQCDSEADCLGGEDEKGCDTPVNTTCEPTYFKCLRSGKCIPGRWKCDQVKNELIKNFKKILELIFFQKPGI